MGKGWLAAAGLFAVMRFEAASRVKYHAATQASSNAARAQPARFFTRLIF